MSTSTKPQGVINNNPFDLMYSYKIDWLGQVKPQQEGTRLLKFHSPFYGIRAGMIDARTKVYIHKYNTLDKFIPVFAPSNENDTEQYIINMAKWLCIKRTDIIELDTIEKLVLWAKCICRQEVGEDWFADTIFLAAANSVLKTVK